MKKDFSKWNNYTIGNISWINSRRKRLSGCHFVEYAKQFDSILEIGGGELVEAQLIKPIVHKYHVLDISETFLEHAKGLGFHTHHASMNDTGLPDKAFSIVYCNHVLEHSPDIKRTIKELKRISRRYYITMFKWRLKTGGLDSVWHNGRKFYSTTFNICELLSLFGNSIKELFVSDVDNKTVQWDKYLKSISHKNMDIHRDKNHYLHIVGEW